MALAALPLSLTSCSLPKDPHNTSQNVMRGTLRAGLVGDAAQSAAGRVLLSQFADELGVTLEVMRGDAHELVGQLETGRLHLIASLPYSTPLEERVGLSRRFQEPVWADPERAWAVRSGENAWLLRANQFLAHKAATTDEAGP